MSKLYNKYIELKKQNSDLFYLFKSGIFYIFLDEDAKKICQITTLKSTKLNDEIIKCGFPKSQLEKYISIFKELKIDINIIDENNSIESKTYIDELLITNIIEEIKKINVNTTTPIECLNLITEWSKLLNNG